MRIKRILVFAAGIVLAAYGFAWGSVAVDAANFPDTSFRSYVSERLDTDGNGILSDEEIANVTNIDVDSMAIYSLQGIGHFTALTSLRCGYNQLTTLDVSNNTALEFLYCYDNQLIALNISNNPALESLYCNSNQLTTLEISNATALKVLECNRNKLTALDFSNNTALESLYCGYNQLSALDFSKNTSLKTLDCDLNQLTALDLRENTALTTLSFLDQAFTPAASSLTAVNNAEYPYRFSIDALNGVDASRMRDIIAYSGDDTIACNLDTANRVIDLATRPTSLRYEYDTGAAIENMSVMTVTLTFEGSESGDDVTSDGVAITAANFPDTAFRNYITSNFDTNNDGILSATEISYATTISIAGLGISSLQGIEYFTSAVNLWCDNNNLTEIDISNNTALVNFSCTGNQITALDVSANTALEQLNCHTNQISSLNLANNRNLLSLNCFANDLNELDVSSNTLLRELVCGENNLTTLNVRNNTDLTLLNFWSNQLTDIDVSNNTNLKELLFYNNRISDINTTNNTALESLSCNGNLITALDLANNTALRELDCYSNQLTALDLSANTALTSLSCANQVFTLQESSITAAGNAEYPYQFSLDNLNGVDAARMSNITASSGNDTIACNIDSANRVIYFAASPSSLQYDYDPQRSEIGASMAVTVNFGDSAVEPIPSGSLEINAANFPDDIFREYVSGNFDTDRNGILDDSEISRVTNIYLFSSDISSLQGIEYFTALTELNCDSNQLTALDVSNNTNLTILVCEGNQLTELNVRNNTALRELHCRWNQLTTLDVSNNTNLTILVCEGNQLTTLDLINNTALREISSDSQAIELTGIYSTGSSSYPYALNLEQVRDQLGVNISVPEFVSNVANYTVLNSEGFEIEGSNFDSENNTLYFSSMPSSIHYAYNTGRSDMNVQAIFSGSAEPGSGDVVIEPIPGDDNNHPSSVISEQFMSRILSAFPGLSSENVFELSENEILTDTSTISNTDIQTLSGRGENIIIRLPMMRPNNSGVYVLPLNLDSNATVGREMKLYLVLQDENGGAVVSASELEDAEYVFFDENYNEIKTVPENRNIYVALRLTSGRTTGGAVTAITELSRGTIEPVAPDELSDEVLETIAETVNISVDEIKFLTEENISDPEEPTPEMTEQARQDNYRLVGKLNTLTVEEEGYYVLHVTLSDDLYEQIRGVNVNQLRIYGLTDDDETGPASVNAASPLFGLLNTWELLTMSGQKLELGVREFLMVGFLSASKPLCLFVAKLLLAFLTGGLGCNAGLGIAGVFIAAGGLIFLKSRKRK